ncbi:hypothetical protein AB0A77_01910 [Streptomyces varsoviensis]|uniref:hypothetical protein n=1 Tax=Streptomyces varsoviensis TaxID=67373 RepID=UPI0033CEB016
MKVKELRRLMNALPVSVDDQDLTVIERDTAETFEITALDVDGTPVMQIELN